MHVVDYSDVDSTAEILASNNVHTVISAISVMDLTSSTAQVNIVQAAAKSKASKRFIASDWGVQHSEE